MDLKVVYLVKTLSRTTRKDYENYVINAIWNRINNPKLIPVSQQYVKGNNGKHHFIDLYFPQLKVGIECDEGYHLRSDQKIQDEERELTINSILSQIDERDYIAYHIDVTKTFLEVEQQINKTVNSIQKLIKELKIEDGWKQFNPDLENYFKKKEFITIQDEVIFPTNKEVYNYILGQNYSYHLMHGGERFHKLYTEYGYEEGTFPWFPKITINKPTNKGYYNLISKNGDEIREFTDNEIENHKRVAENRYIGKKRLVFSQVEDFVTGQIGYRFIGYFIGDHYENNGTIVYKRIDDKFRIIRK